MRLAQRREPRRGNLAAAHPRGVEAAGRRRVVGQGVVERLDEGRHRRIAILRAGGQGPVDHALQAAGESRFGTRLRQGAGRVRQPLDQRFLRRLALEREPPRQQSVEYQPQRILVGAGIDGIAGKLLRAHVVRRAHHEP